ncbi:MAG TPA: diacylglycerol kinase family protein [Niabella sp.]|nr:diacylglycerol kinase family protein [Niabella sp.]HQW14965.1 diacylglycerol kinase family protein [Niabella sp.]HQX20143.1 diacylglycerol kinase family protein [Niabella sp.]HRB06748.1 diacylglycerol kinase family protein [Niabella sp.]HRB27583.1 diacylglycerol kinase family protein [Niabella sp.]
MPHPFSISKLINSFGHAFRGLRTVIWSEQNFRIHTVFAFITLGFTWYFGLSGMETTIIFLCIAAVMVTEILNTAIEKLCDFVSPQFHDKIKIIKDLSAGAVLLMSIVSVIIGVIIFFPKMLQFVQNW